jgi:hypothetical protein
MTLVRGAGVERTCTRGPAGHQEAQGSLVPADPSDTDAGVLPCFCR